MTVTILHSNDTHSNLEPFTPSDEPQQGGIARRKTLIDRVRASELNVLAVDAGDFSQGTLFYNAWKGSSDIMAMNAIGYDAATLGNHEFDLGSKELGRALRGEPAIIANVQHNTEKANFPLVSTNVDASAEPALTGLYRKSLIIERGGEKFGILGVTTDTTANISSPGPNIRFLDYVASVQAEADHLRHQGVNKIILLSHYGYDVDSVKARQLSGVDLIVSGHDHALLGAPADIGKVVPAQKDRVKGPYPTVVKDRDGQNVLIVSAYEWGRWLGQIKVTFDQSGLIQDGAWQSHPIFVRGCDQDDCSKEAAPEDAVLPEEEPSSSLSSPVGLQASTQLARATENAMGKDRIEPPWKGRGRDHICRTGRTPVGVSPSIPRMPIAAHAAWLVHSLAPRPVSGWYTQDMVPCGALSDNTFPSLGLRACCVAPLEWGLRSHVRRPLAGCTVACRVCARYRAIASGVSTTAIAVILP